LQPIHFWPPLFLRVCPTCVDSFPIVIIFFFPTCVSPVGPWPPSHFFLVCCYWFATHPLSQVHLPPFPVPMPFHPRTVYFQICSSLFEFPFFPLFLFFLYVHPPPTVAILYFPPNDSFSPHLWDLRTFFFLNHILNFYVSCPVAFIRRDFFVDTLFFLLPPHQIPELVGRTCASISGLQFFFVFSYGLYTSPNHPLLTSFTLAFPPLRTLPFAKWAPVVQRIHCILFPSTFLWFYWSFTFAPTGSHCFI